MFERSTAKTSRAVRRRIRSTMENATSRTVHCSDAERERETAPTRSGTTRFAGMTRGALLRLVMPTHTWNKDCVTKFLAENLGRVVMTGPVHFSLRRSCIVQLFSQTVVVKRRNALSIMARPLARIGGRASCAHVAAFGCFIARLWRGHGLSLGIVTPPEYSSSRGCERQAH